MTISGELRNLEKVQTRLVKLCNYIENNDRYKDLYSKINNVIGAIENALDYAE